MMKLISILLIKIAFLLHPCEHVWVPDYIMNEQNLNIPTVVNWNPPVIKICPKCNAKMILTTESRIEIKYE